MLRLMKLSSSLKSRDLKTNSLHWQQLRGFALQMKKFGVDGDGSGDLGCVRGSCGGSCAVG